MISGGDVKAVQGTTGHATADMLVNTYAHIQQSSRVELGKKFKEGFYANQESPSPQAVPAAGEPTISMTALLELLKNADPEVKAQLRLGHVQLPETEQPSQSNFLIVCNIVGLHIAKYAGQNSIPNLPLRLNRTNSSFIFGFASRSLVELVRMPIWMAFSILVMPTSVSFNCFS